MASGNALRIGRGSWVRQPAREIPGQGKRYGHLTCLQGKRRL
jgi:hypothetical protein